MGFPRTRTLVGVVALAAVATAVTLEATGHPPLLSEHFAHAAHSPDPRQTTTVIPVGWHAQSLTFDGTARRYLLTDGVPSGEKAPLVLLFHGLAQTTQAFVGNTAIATSAQRAGVIVAAPISPNNAWNDGRLGRAGRNDDGFAMAIASTLEARGLVDPDRVTVAGFSNGAGMAMEIAARHPDEIAALVSIDGELLSGPMQSRPTGPVPAYFVHGTDDPVQPLDGRRERSPLLPGQISEQQTVADFRDADGIEESRPKDLEIPESGHAVVGPIHILHWDRHGDDSVTYALINGMGHKWPALACGSPAADAHVARSALPLSASTPCSNVSAPGTRLANIGANALVIGVAQTARLHPSQV